MLDDATVEVADGRVAAVRPPRSGDGAPLDGLIVPGLVNAHTHLELGALGGRVSGGDGFLGWLSRLRPLLPPPPGAVDAARAAWEAGTGWLNDVSSAGDTAPALRAAGLGGVVYHELLGFDPEAVGRHAGPLSPRRDGHVLVRPTPHALFSTSPALVSAAVRAGPPDVPATLHVGESGDEAAFLSHGAGPHAALLDALGRDWRWWRPPGTGPLHALDALGVLGPGLLLVHAVHIAPAERALAAARGAPVCLCPRSNLHIGGRLPDAPAWLDSGVPMAIGTDSRASCPDADVLAELAVLAEAFPRVPAARWLALATHEGARATGAPPDAGRLCPGSRGGVLLLEGVGDAAGALRHPPARRWLSPPAWAAPPTARYPSAGSPP